jgi:Tfp pilus assembly protein PilX
MKDIDLIRKNQGGFASFFVTIMVMIIFGIIILSFSQISNKETTNALNRVLSTQALYAAQSGINDAYSIIRSDEASNQTVIQQTNSCTGTGTYVSQDGQNVGSNSKYTCLLVNTNPSTLQYQCPEYCPNNSIIANIRSVVNQNIYSLSLTWAGGNNVPTNGCSTNEQFLPSTSWNCPIVLRVDLVPFQSGSSTVSDLESGSRTFFLYPQVGPVGDINFQTLNNSQYIYPANCSNNDNSCTTSIFNLNTASDPGGEYYMRIQYYYGTPSTIAIDGNDTSSQSISFVDSQIQIEANGVDGAVSKRLSAFINPLSGESSPYSLPLPPNYALQSTSSICKSFLVDNSTTPSLSSNDLYEVVPPTNLLPGSEINYVLTPSTLSSGNPSAPTGAGIATPTPAPSSGASNLVPQNEVTSDNPTDPCNPI